MGAPWGYSGRYLNGWEDFCMGELACLTPPLLNTRKGVGKMMEVMDVMERRMESEPPDAPP